ncbi:hypothetical protein GZ178_11225, partial [Dermatophilus congolensis]
PTPTEKIRATITEQRRTTTQQAEKLTPHWPISLTIWALIGATATAYTTRRLKIPGPAAYGEHTIHHAPTNT